MKNIILQNFHWDQNFVFQLNRFQPEIIRDLLHLEILEEQLDSIFSVILYKKLSEPLLRLNNSLKKRKKREIFQQTICSVIIICVTRQNFLLGFTLTMLKTIKNKKNKINPVEYGFFWTENISEQGNIEIIYNKRNILLSSAIISTFVGTGLFFLFNSFSVGPRIIIEPLLKPLIQPILENSIVEPLTNAPLIPPFELFKLINVSLTEAINVLQNLELHQYYDVPSLKIKVSILEAAIPIYRNSVELASDYYPFLISKDYGNSFLFRLKLLNDLLEKSCKTDPIVNTFCQQVANRAFQQ
jgi:hypothetical protein